MFFTFKTLIYIVFFLVTIKISNMTQVLISIAVSARNFGYIRVGY